jgi:iron(III) transport system permease protein
MAAPLLYLLYQGLSVAPGVWARLLGTRVPSLLLNTLMLTGFVTVGALLLGLLLAWLVERTDLPARRIVGPLLLAPFIVSPLVMAISYVGFFGVGGLLDKTWRGLGFSPYGLGGTAWVLILSTYPFVYVLMRAALRGLDPTLLDVARCSGASRARIALRLTLPLLAPAMSAGAFLAALYALADFEVPALMRYPTFVTVIFQQLTGRYDASAASALGTVLVFLMILMLWGQRGLWWGRRRFVPERVSSRPWPVVPLRTWKIPALALIFLVLLAGLLLPLGVLSFWLVNSWLIPQASVLLWGTSGTALLGYMLNGFWVSAAAATLAILLALPIAYGSVRYRDRLSQTWAWLAQAGQALPGVLIALGLLFLVLRFLPGLYATVWVVILAYLVRFFPQALQPLRSGLAQIPVHLEEGARLLGQRPLGAFAKVVLPLLWPALAGGWTLVFLSALRELPATLLLRPAGFDTLPVRIWTAAGEGFYAQAAPAALLLVAISIPLLVWLHGGSSAPGSMRSYG